MRPRCHCRSASGLAALPTETASGTVMSGRWSPQQASREGHAWLRATSTTVVMMLLTARSSQLCATCGSCSRSAPVLGSRLEVPASCVTGALSPLPNTGALYGWL